MKDLKGKTNFPKVPSDKQIDSTFAGWLKKVQLDAKQQLKLKALPHKYKFRLCWRHDERVKKLQEEDEKKQQTMQEVNKIVDKVMIQANSVNLSSMLRCLQQQELLNVRVKQLLTRGTIQHLVNTLMKLELISRQHKSTRDSITIIRIFDSLMGEQTAISAMKDTPMFFKVVFSIFHPIEPEITGQMLSLIGSRKGFCWQSEDSIKLILEAMNDFKIEYKLSNRFDIVVRTIYHSKNVVMIYHLLTFLLHFLLSFEDKALNSQVLLELQETIVHGKKIDEVFKQIKLRVKQGKYQIIQCTYDSVRISLNSFVHPLANNGVTNLEMFDDSDPLKSKSIESIQQSSLPDNFQEEIKTKYYLETHETQMFEEIQKQVMELVDAIMNIDQIMDLIEQQDLEEIDSDKEVAQHSVFYMDIESSKNHSFGELCASDSELGGTTFRASQEHPRHSKILNDDKLLDEIKLLEEKNAVIIHNYDDAQNQLHELQFRITQLESQYELKSQEQQSIHDEQIGKLKSELIVLKQQVELLTQQLNELQLKQQSQQEYPVTEIHHEVPQEIVIDEVDDVSVSRHASSDSSDSSDIVIPTKSIDSHVIAQDIIEQLIEDVSTPYLQMELVNPLEDDDVIVIQSTDVEQIQQVEQTSIMVPRTITSIRVTITNDISTQTESKVYQEQLQQTDVIEPPPPQQIAPQVLPPPPPPQQQIAPQVLPPPPPPPLLILPPPPLLQKQSQSAPPLPPPPPPPMKGHAPPPPPPMKGSVPPPPPPPKGNNQMAQTVRPTSNVPSKQLPQVPMKPLNWVLVNQQNIKSTIFTFLDDKQPTLNVEFLEQHFNKPKLEKKDVVKSAQSLQLKVLLLNPERSKNIELVLGKLKLPYQLIAKALLSCDSTVLTQSTLDSLDSICPTEEEVKLIVEYPEDRQNFGNSEQFVDAIRQVNGYQNRIKGLRFSNTINECVNDLQKKCRQLTQVFMKLPTMKEIQVLFTTTLAIGNFMNAQSSKGNAIGFKLDIIEKTADIKSIDNSTTLLYHIIEQSELILQKDLITENDISEIEIISKLPVSQLTVDLSELKKGQQILRKAIDCWTNEESDKVVVKLQPHLEKVTETIVEIETNIVNLESEYQKCAVYFCENPKDASDKLGDKVIRLFRQIIKTKTEQKQKDDRKKKVEEQKQKEQDRLAKSQQLSSNTLQPPQAIKPIPPKGADPKQFQMSQNELLKQLSKRQNQGQQNSFINNELKELQKIKQKRGSILFQQL